MITVSLLSLTRKIERGWAWWMNPRTRRHMLRSPRGRLYDYFRSGRHHFVALNRFESRRQDYDRN